VSTASVAVGQWVKSLSLGLEGELLAVDGAEGVLQLGALKTRRPLKDLAPAVAKPRKPRSDLKTEERAKRAAAAPLEIAHDFLDLRGLRAEDALREAQQFLDRAFGEGRQAVKFVHGHGTGALKASLRELLSESRYVRSYRAADLTDGGEGATIVDLAV
jgi:DNA mismatch repair protein MutS2